MIIRKNSETSDNVIMVYKRHHLKICLDRLRKDTTIFRIAAALLIHSLKQSLLNTKD